MKSTHWPHLFAAICAASLLPASPLLAQVRVACVGDSITAGLNVAGGSSYPSQLATLLGSGYKVNNYGWPGTTLMSNTSLLYIQQTVYTQSLNFNPNIVLIMLGTNDAGDGTWANHSTFVSDYNALIASYRNLAAHPAVYVMASPYVYGSGFGGNMATTLNTQVVPLITHIAAANGAPLVDVHSATENHPEWFPDNVHPNATGYGEVATVVAQAIQRGVKGVPAPWSNVDVNSPVQPGASSSYDGHSFSLVGGGADIWGASDQFQFCSQTIQSDGSIVARVLTVENTNAWAKVGVMIRESSAASSRFVDALITPGSGSSAQWRNASAPSGASATTAGIAAPYWVRLDRIGGNVSAYFAPYSAGAPGAWTLRATQPIATGAALIGLCACSHDNTTSCLATFDNVAVTRTYQAESLSVLQSSGDTNQIISWPGFTNGSGANYLSDAVGDYVSYTVPNVPAGTYHVYVGAKKFPTRGVCQLSVAAAGQTSFTTVGAAEEQYANPEAFSEFDQGLWSPISTSDKAFKFTVTGRNSGSSGYTLAFDYIRLVLQ